MSDFDPTDPWGSRSPWETANPEPQTTTAPEAPMTSQPAPVSPNPFKIGFTLKAAHGYEAEWLTPTVFGSTAEETAQRGKDLLLAMKSIGLIEFTAQAAQFTRGQYLGDGNKPAAPAAQPSFQNGQVQYSQPAPAGPSRPNDVPSHYTYKEGQKNGKTWKGWFPPKGSNESPVWVS